KNMITAIAVSPTNPDLLAVLAIPTAIGQQAGIYVSADAGKTWRFTMPADLPAPAYPYSIQSAPGVEGHFYLFLTYAGWLETQDLGRHWRAITDKNLANMQTSSLLIDPQKPGHLLMGSNTGLFETDNDGQSWQRLTPVQGSVFSLVATSLADGKPRR